MSHTSTNDPGIAMIVGLLAEGGKIEKTRVLVRKQAVDKLLLEVIGMGPTCSDPTYTQHPLMAGTLRQLIGAAFDAGASALMRELLKERARAPRWPTPAAGTEAEPQKASEPAAEKAAADPADDAARPGDDEDAADKTTAS